MSVQQFSQALIQERIFVIACQAYHPPAALLQIVESIQNRDQRLCLAFPYSSLEQNHTLLANLNVWKGLSDIPSMAPHTFTSDIAIRLAKEANIDFVIIGDSTARHVLYETDHSIATKLRGLLEADIPAIVCFGETAQEHARGFTAEIIKEQLSTLLLGLTFEQMMKTLLVYRAPWLNTIDPELFVEEHDKTHHLVLDTLKFLFGDDIASHIPLLTDLPFIDEDFHKISDGIPPSGYFLELGGLEPHLVSSYFETLHTANFGGPFLPPPPSSPEKEHVTTPTNLSQPPPKAKKSKKKKIEEVVIAPSEEEIPSKHEAETTEILDESVHETILSVDHELDTPTIHFEINEPTTLETLPEAENENTESEMSLAEEFKLEWYSDEELEALRNEFGIQSKEPFELKPYPVWDNTLPIRIIKTQAQKAEEASKRKKSKKSR